MVMLTWPCENRVDGFNYTSKFTFCLLVGKKTFAVEGFFKHAHLNYEKINIFDTDLLLSLLLMLQGHHHINVLINH